MMMTMMMYYSLPCFKYHAAYQMSFTVVLVIELSVVGASVGSAYAPGN